MNWLSRLHDLINARRGQRKAEQVEDSPFQHRVRSLPALHLKPGFEVVPALAIHKCTGERNMSIGPKLPRKPTRGAFGRKRDAERMTERVVRSLVRMGYTRKSSTAGAP